MASTRSPKPSAAEMRIDKRPWNPHIWSLTRTPSPSSPPTALILLPFPDFSSVTFYKCRQQDYSSAERSIGTQPRWDTHGAVRTPTRFAKMYCNLPSEWCLAPKQGLFNNTIPFLKTPQFSMLTVHLVIAVSSLLLEGIWDFSGASLDVRMLWSDIRAALPFACGEKAHCCSCAQINAWCHVQTSVTIPSLNRSDSEG